MKPESVINKSYSNKNEASGALISSSARLYKRRRGMATFIGHWGLRGFGLWVVQRKSDGAFLGRVGLWQPEGWPGMEVGWGLGRAYWGQGYAREAARASLDYGFRNYAIPKIISLIHPDNHASKRLAERLGETKGAPFQLVTFGKSSDVEIWEIPRERWSQIKSGN
jgi:RimJ/RimL family protein N-acetyltransferase